MYVNLDETTAQRLERAFWLKAQIKDLTEEVDLILNAIGPNVGTYDGGDYTLQVTPNVRFNAAEAKKNLTPEQYASILKSAPDSKLAKAVLDPEDYIKAQATVGVVRKIVETLDD